MGYPFGRRDTIRFPCLPGNSRVNVLTGQAFGIRENNSMLRCPIRALTIVTCLCLSLLGLPLASGVSQGARSEKAPTRVEGSADRAILFILEGVGQESFKAAPMPVMRRLTQEGSVTWSATATTPPLRLPTMASLLTGMPVDKHGVTWNSFDFMRGYPRPPTLFDYLDLSGGKDSAIFFMDESLYQLAKPTPYTDYQMCGPLKPECNPETLLRYIKQYFKKATSGHGYGHAGTGVPDFLVVHLPQAGRAGIAEGWNSPAYRDALRSVDKAMGAVLDLYRELGLLKRAAIFVTGLNGYGGSRDGQENGHGTGSAPQVPWIASGPGVKAGHRIEQSVSILDTGATIMRAMGLETYTEWESRPVEEIFTQPFVARPKADTVEF